MNHKSITRLTIRRLQIAFVALVGCAAGQFELVEAAAPETAAAAPTQGKSPGRSDKSYYLPMRDGVRVAVNLYFPGGVPPTKPSPVLLIQTRYGRATAVSHRQPWLQAGYVVATVDTRGSTASFGPRIVDIGPEEVRDMDEIIAHLASQAWSNGKVIATGASYAADTADWATSRPAQALVASIPQETDFDTYLDLFFPGGVMNDSFLERWGGYTRETDLGRDGRGKGLDCVERIADCAKLFPILQPVDDDADFIELRKAVTGRKRWGPADYAAAEFRDDKGLNGYTMFSSSPASDLAGIRRERKPVQYWGSWFDAGTAEAALARFRSAPKVPAEVWITGNNHSQSVGADPFFPDRKTPLPAGEEGNKITMDFADRTLHGQAIQRVINYYVAGGERFEHTTVWPPADARRLTLSFAPEHKLNSTKSRTSGVDRYEVDFTATTGKETRWSTQFGAPPAYPDRQQEDQKLLHYDAPAVGVDTEIVGTPVLSLNIATATVDPAFFVYLEDVAPDGRVTYVTEGEFRAIHRKLIRPTQLPYDQGSVSHSFNRADAQPMGPGISAMVRFELFPVAALIRKGHHIRIAIAGADDGTFHRYSQGQADTFSVSYGGSKGSALELTTRPWRP